ncbi:Immunoglobulin-like fold [Cinara cedri]|uniref:Immunoglobulin-like fold n=1 Tax=Cinara cedri TaxID=506608 RepID=A0A5E4MB11_9HEMI|nr:Immunoglobulin-like fold [Cinara cedri]
MEPRRIRHGRPGDPQSTVSRWMMVVFFMSMYVLQIIAKHAQVVAGPNVVRIVRVDVPTIFPVYDPSKPVKDQPTLIFECAYKLKGGENDGENGEVRPTNATPVGTTTPSPELALDDAIDKEQRERGLVIKWYFRRNPIPDDPDPMAKFNDNEQVYQWMPGEPGGPLGALLGHAVDITDETPRKDKTSLHRVIRVERPSFYLTGEYRCQVEDWTAERRSAWQPIVIYLPERVFKVLVSDVYDDDVDDDENNNEGAGSDLGNVNSSTVTTSTSPPVPTTSSSNSASSTNNFPTKINITCYAAGMHPEPSMGIWVNGVEQQFVSVLVLEDDGDDDETNDEEVKNVTTTTTTTTPRPRVHHWNRYRSYREGEVFRNYSIRASKVVSLKDVEQYGLDENNRTTERPADYRPYTIDVECRLKMPGDDTADGFWKSGRPDNLYYSVRKSVAYKYRADPPPPPPDAFTSVSSASSVADADDVINNGKDAAVSRGSNAGSGPQPAGIHFIQSMIVAGVAAAARQ